MPGVSAPSSVVRSIIRTASSNACSFDSFLIERLASVAARSSSATASTEPIRGSRGSSGSSKPRGRAGECGRLGHAESVRRGELEPAERESDRRVKWRGRGGAGRIEDRRGGGGGFVAAASDPDGQGGRRRHRHDPARPPLSVPLLAGRRRASGIDPGTGQFPQARAQAATDLDKAPADEPAKFVEFVAGDVDATWTEALRRGAKTYEPRPSSSSTTASSPRCGNAPSTVGPFYCPRGPQVYIDLGFMPRAAAALQRARRLRAGVHRRARDRPPRPEPARREDGREPRAAGESRTTPTSSRCGSSCRPTASRASGRTRPTRATCSRRGDLEEGLNAAAAVGDDRIQKQSGRGVDPDSFTHGSSEQRVTWFRAGLRERRPGRLRHLQGRRLARPGRRERREDRPYVFRPAPRLGLADERPGLAVVLELQTALAELSPRAFSMTALSLPGPARASSIASCVISLATEAIVAIASSAQAVSIRCSSLTAKTSAS